MALNFEEYSKIANSTKLYEDKIIYPCLGLAGESGEVCDKVKKVLRDNAGIFSKERKENIMYELGDVLWYVNAIATDLGFTLEEVAKCNNDKLLRRLKENKIHGDGDKR